MEKTVTIKSNKKFKLTNMSDMTVGTLAIAGIGTLGGFVFAYYNQKNYWISMLVGLLAGGVIGNVAIRKLTK